MNEKEYIEYRKEIIKLLDSLGYKKVRHNSLDELPKTYRRNKGLQINPSWKVAIHFNDWNYYFNFAPVCVHAYRHGTSIVVGGNVSDFRLDVIGFIKGEVSEEEFIESAFNGSRISV